MEQRHEPIQVTGEFVLDEDCLPLQLSNVTMIEPVGLSPFAIDRVVLPSENSIEFGEVQEIIPSLDEETQQYFVASLPDLGLAISVPVRSCMGARP